QGYPESAENGFPDEGKPRDPRAGDAQEVGGSRNLSTDPGGARWRGVIRSPRRSTVCEWRRAHGHGPQQDSEGSGREIENDGGLSSPLSAGLGLPRFADRIQGSERIAGPFAARGAEAIGSV